MRGFIDVTLMQAVMIVLTALLLVAIVPRLYESGIMLVNPTQNPTVANMIELEKGINGLISNPDKNAIEKFPYYIESEKALVGFSRGEEKIWDKCYYKEVERPIECGDSSCLCVMETPDFSVKKCIQYGKVNSFYSLRMADGEISETFQRSTTPVYDSIKDMELNYEIGEETKALQSTGGRAETKLDFPKKLSQIVIHGYCANVPAPVFGSGMLYVELQKEQGFNHILLTPAIPYTNERYKTLQRGMTVEEAERVLKQAMTYPDCLVDVTGFCFDADKYGEIYSRTRAIHDKQFEDHKFLLQFAERLRENKNERAKQVYRDYVKWFDNAGNVEAYYNLARLTYAPESIFISDTELLEETKEDLIEAAGYATQAIARNRPGNPYWQHAYYIRGLYYMMLGNYRQAREDISQYNALLDEEIYAEQYPSYYYEYGVPRYNLEKGIMELDKAKTQVMNKAPPEYRIKYQTQHNKLLDANENEDNSFDVEGLIYSIEPNYKVHTYAYIIARHIIGNDKERAKAWNEHLLEHEFKPLAEFARRDIQNINAGQQTAWEELPLPTEEFFIIAHEK